MGVAACGGSIVFLHVLLGWQRAPVFPPAVAAPLLFLLPVVFSSLALSVLWLFCLVTLDCTGCALFFLFDCPRALATIPHLRSVGMGATTSSHHTQQRRTRRQRLHTRRAAGPPARATPTQPTQTHSIVHCRRRGHAPPRAHGGGADAAAAGHPTRPGGAPRRRPPPPPRARGTPPPAAPAARPPRWPRPAPPTTLWRARTRRERHRTSVRARQRCHTHTDTRRHTRRQQVHPPRLQHQTAHRKRAGLQKQWTAQLHSVLEQHASHDEHAGCADQPSTPGDNPTRRALRASTLARSARAGFPSPWTHARSFAVTTAPAFQVHVLYRAAVAAGSMPTCRVSIEQVTNTAGPPHGPRVFIPTDIARAIIWDTGGGGAPTYRRPVASRWSWLSAR